MSLNATTLKDLIVDGRLDSFEQIPINAGMFNLFNKQAISPSGIIPQDVRLSLATDPSIYDREVQVPVLNRNNLAVANVRSLNLPLVEDTSAMVNASFKTYSTGFKVVFNELQGNAYTPEKIMKAKLKQVKDAFFKAIEADAITALDAAKNAFYPADVLAGTGYTNLGDSLQVTDAQSTDFYNTIQAVMEDFDFTLMGDSKYDAIGSAYHARLVNRFVNQGAGNASNEQFQFFPFDYSSSNQIVVPAAPVTSSVYVVAPDSLSYVTRLQPDNLMEDSTEWEVKDTINLPFFDFPVEQSYRKQREDQSATFGVGYEDVWVQEWRFSFDLAFYTPYISDTVNQAVPIIKADLQYTGT